MNVTGLEVDGSSILPKVMSSIVGDRGTFFDVTFESNPLDGSCDTKIVVNARPLEVAYDGVCISNRYVICGQNLKFAFRSLNAVAYNLVEVFDEYI